MSSPYICTGHFRCILTVTYVVVVVVVVVVVRGGGGGGGGGGVWTIDIMLSAYTATIPSIPFHLNRPKLARCRTMYASKTSHYVSHHPNILDMSSLVKVCTLLVIVPGVQ